MLLRVRVARKRGDRHRRDDAQLVLHLVDIDAGVFYGFGHAAAALALQSLKVLRHLVVELGRVFVEQLFEALVLPRDLTGRVEAARVFVDGLELDAVIHVLRRVEVLFLLFLFLFFLVLPPSEQAALFLALVFAALLLGVRRFHGLDRRGLRVRRGGGRLPCGGLALRRGRCGALPGVLRLRRLFLRLFRFRLGRLRRLLCGRFGLRLRLRLCGAFRGRLARAPLFRQNILQCKAIFRAHLTCLLLL